MPFPSTRLHRLRAKEAARRMVRETRLSIDELIMPLFVRPGKGVRAQIPSMPGQFQFSVDQLVQECRELAKLGIPGVLLFGLPSAKDERGSGAYAKDGVVQQAVRAIKAAVPTLLVITDVCLCAYTEHGHCGIVRTKRPRAGGARTRAKRGSPGARTPPPPQPFWIDNDATLELLAKTALSHAQAGGDMVAPSDMMDGNVGAIRRALDQADLERVPIMAYSAKYASSLYAPFRQAVNSSPQFGDRRSYQMDLANGAEALREVQEDIEEGADIVIVKPALACLDIIARIKAAFGHPLAAFSVSGEYAMVKAASARGWLVERQVWLEQLTSLKRAGADLLITYWAKDAARHLQKG